MSCPAASLVWKCKEPAILLHAQLKIAARMGELFHGIAYHTSCKDRTCLGLERFCLGEAGPASESQVATAQLRMRVLQLRSCMPPLAIVLNKAYV